MRIRNVLRLRPFIEADDPPDYSTLGAKAPADPFLPPEYGVRRRVANGSELEGTSNYRQPQRAMEHFVSKNWRLTFPIDRTEIEFFDFAYENYR